MRVAIVHYWLVGMRGGEKVIESLCNVFPGADIFTHVVDPAKLSDALRQRNIKTSFINRLPGAKKHYQKYLPLMPLALEQLDLRGYDLIISSESGPAKGVIPPPQALHVCYCHSPMRYIWNMYHDYRERTSMLTKVLMPIAAHYIRNWDVLSATRVDHFVANSHTVRERIHRYYHRDAHVIYPPVDVDQFEPSSNAPGDGFLMVGELVPYKRVELAVEAFNRMGRPLTIIGGGERLSAIKSLAGPTIRVTGPQPFNVLKQEYAQCRALIFPGEEDFGIVPVEALASGRPVIAYARGGATETVVDGLSGVLFNEQSADAIVEAVERFDDLSFDPLKIAHSARRFAASNFEKRFAITSIIYWKHVERLRAMECIRKAESKPCNQWVRSMVDAPLLERPRLCSAFPARSDRRNARSLPTIPVKYPTWSDTRAISRSAATNSYDQPFKTPNTNIPSIINMLPAIKGAAENASEAKRPKTNAAKVSNSIDFSNAPTCIEIRVNLRGA